MNSEMLPFILFLLYSDDLRQQSDRIILELRNENSDRNKAFGSQLADTLKDQDNTLFNKTREYFSGQYSGIIDQMKNSSDPKKITAELIPLIRNEGTLLYNRTTAYLDEQYASIIKELKNRDSKEIAAEIMAALKNDETEFFDRAANHVFMYYTELKDEIKANSNIHKFNQELSRHLKGNNEIIIKRFTDYIDKNNTKITDEITTGNAKKFAEQFIAYMSNADVIKANHQFQKDQLSAMETIKETMMQLKETVNGINKKSNKVLVKKTGISAKRLYKKKL